MCNILLQEAIAFSMPIIEKYYRENRELLQILLTHSKMVAQKALDIINTKNLHSSINPTFTAQAAMLHDIGIINCNAPTIHCYGQNPYICHGTIGKTLLEKENLPHHALVCERHTGAGITAQEIIQNALPLPSHDMLPLSPEEKIICYADKFYSKSSNLTTPKSIEEILSSIKHHGNGPYNRFLILHNEFKC